MVKKLTTIGIVIAILTLLSMWIIPMCFKENKPALHTNGDYSPAIAASDNAKVAVRQNIQVVYPDEREVQRLKAELEKAKEYKHPFPNRAKVVPVDPFVEFINYVDTEHYNGLVKGGFNIPLINIGGVVAMDISTEWKIYDDNKYITSAKEYFKHDPLFIKELQPNKVVTLKYYPDIGADGTGTLKLIFTYTYIDSKSGEKYSEKYNWLVDYKTENNNKPRLLRLSEFEP